MKKTPLKLLQSSIKVLLTREVFTRQMIFWNKSTYLIRNNNSWKLYAKYYIYAIKRWFHENTWLIVFSSISSPIFLTTIPYAIIIIIATINAAGKRRLRVQKNRPSFFYFTRVTCCRFVERHHWWVDVLYNNIDRALPVHRGDVLRLSSRSIRSPKWQECRHCRSLYRLLSQWAEVKKLSEKTVSSFPSIDSLDTNDDHDDRVAREETRNVVEQLAERGDGQTLANRIDR